MVKICTLHNDRCPRCGYNGGFFGLEVMNNTSCPACRLEWKFITHDDKLCQHHEQCDQCNEPVNINNAKTLDTYDTPWDTNAETKYFCSENCQDRLFDTSWGDFRYFTCSQCCRIICEQNPKNGWHTQNRIMNGEMICLKCYEEEILCNGIPKERFAHGSIPGIFFGSDNEEPLGAGYQKEGSYFIKGTHEAREFCNRAISLINKGNKVVVGYESLGIGGGEGHVTLFCKHEKN